MELTRSTGAGFKRYHASGDRQPLLRLVMIFAVLLALFLPEPAPAQEPTNAPEISVGMRTGYGFPLKKGEDDLFSWGMPFDAVVGLTPGWSAPIGFTANVGISILNLEQSLSGEKLPSPGVVHFGPGVSLRLPLSDRLELTGHGEGGPFAVGGNTDTDYEWSGWLTGGVGAGFKIWPSLSLSLDVSYREFFGLYHDVAVTLGARYHIPSGTRDQRTASASGAVADPLRSRTPTRLISVGLPLGYSLPLPHGYSFPDEPVVQYPVRLGVHAESQLPLQLGLEAGHGQCYENGEPTSGWNRFGYRVGAGFPLSRAWSLVGAISGGASNAWISGSPTEYLGWFSWAGAEVGLQLRPLDAFSLALTLAYHESFGLGRDVAFIVSPEVHIGAARGERAEPAPTDEPRPTPLETDEEPASAVERRPFSLGTTIAAHLPITDPENLFSWSEGMLLVGSWNLASPSWLEVQGYAGLKVIFDSGFPSVTELIGTMPLGLGVGGTWPLADSLSWRARVGAGPFLGWLWQDPWTGFEWSAWASAQLGLQYNFTPGFSLSADLVYRELLGLTRDIGLMITPEFHFGQGRAAAPAAREQTAEPEIRPEPLEEEKERPEIEPQPLSIESNISYPISLSSIVGIDSTYSNLGGTLSLAFQPLKQTPVAITANVGLEGIGLVGSGNYRPASFSLGAKFGWSLSDRLALLNALGVGASYNVVQNREVAINPWSLLLSGSLGLRYQPWAHVSFLLQLKYREFFATYRDLELSLGTAYHFGGGLWDREPREREPREWPQLLQRDEEPEEEVVQEESDAEVAQMPEGQPEEAPAEEEPEVLAGLETGFGTMELAIDPIFPVFYSNYDNNPVGRATITNSGRQDVENVSVSMFVDQYMDNPKASDTVPVIASGETVELDIYGLFTRDILEITEGEKLSTLFTLTYTERGTEVSEEFIETIEAYNRNALTWDDDEKICAFVTARDPAVMRFARNTTGFTQSSIQRGVNNNLAAAIGLHEALDIYGMHYIPDPTTPYTEFSKESTVVDYLLFPRQTLQYQGGDCDDLTALYCALLESVGVETAFITIPGHIYAAFSLGIGVDEARSAFRQPDDLIFHEGTAWVPVEITLRDEGFIKAWQEGAKQWRENSGADQAEIYRVTEGWETYPPVGLPGSADLNPFDGDEVTQAFRREVLAFVDAEIAQELATIQVRMDADPRNARWPNRLGILYAGYGVDERAISYFEQALRLRPNYVPALVNLGNVHYLAEDVFAALDYYEQAERLAPDNPTVLLNIARVNHDIENYGTARRAYARLQQVAPSLANRFAYLDLRGAEAARAAEAGEVGDYVIWSEEEGGEE